MEQDIRKLAAWIEKATREQIAIERQILQWRISEKHPVSKPATMNKG
jgi:hypothetical protein